MDERQPTPRKTTGLPEYTDLVRRVLSDDSIHVVEDPDDERRTLRRESINGTPAVAFYDSANGRFYGTGVKERDLSTAYVRELCKDAKTVTVSFAGEYIILCKD